MEFINLTPVLPELYLACSGMALLLFGVFRGPEAYRTVSWLAIVICLGAGLLLSLGAGKTVAFGGQFITDDFARFMKWLVVLGSSLTIVMAISFNRRESMAHFEYPVLILFSTLGMFMMISANDLISLYVGLELQSLSLYVLAAFRRDSLRSSEAGLKYFVLGALSSGMLLYGASLIYGFTGTTSFSSLANSLPNAGSESIGVIVGLIFLITGMAFKISAVPFHTDTGNRIFCGCPQNCGLCSLHPRDVRAFWGAR